MQDWRSGYSQQEFDNVEIILFDKKIYVLLTLRRHVLDWYHLYINRPSGSRLSNIIRQLCYYKCLVSQAEIYIKTCKKFQQFKNRKTLYGKLPPNIISALKLCNSVHIYLIGPYAKSIKQQQPGGSIIQKDVSLTCMIIIDPATGWFKTIGVPCFEIY